MSKAGLRQTSTILSSGSSRSASEGDRLLTAHSCCAALADSQRERLSRSVMPTPDSQRCCQIA